MSGNRWGLNVVSGWSEREFGMMGISLAEHARRYERTSCFVEILQKLWSAEAQPFDYECDWYSVSGGESSPIPDVPPMIANAGVSEDAKNMTARLCDWAFVSTPSVDAVGSIIDDIALKAKGFGRSVKTAIFPFLIWGDSRAEAEDRLASIISEKDEVATANWLHDLSAGSGSFDAFTSDMLAASGGGVHMVGSAADVAEQLIDAHRAGVSAVMLTFPEYLADLHRFAREIQPTLIKADCIAAN